MNVITLASRKGGAGKSTLTAHLAACAHAGGYRSLVIDADPQGSVTLWHSLRRQGGPALQSATRGIERAVTFAAIEGYEWVFIDTHPPHGWSCRKPFAPLPSCSSRRGPESSI